MNNNQKHIKKLKKEFLNFISKNNVVTTSEIASKFNLSWNTVEKYLLELTIDKKVERIKKSRTNLWMLKKITKI
ncbi:MAG: hypothetical protein IB618_01520 [Candidatus Pacearchaeota archaeon]|nr:MAG: hypothetical protein IB618_01520 [Candidatus Pacearchaeota archaeon]